MPFVHVTRRSPEQHIRESRIRTTAEGSGKLIGIADSHASLPSGCNSKSNGKGYRALARLVGNGATVREQWPGRGPA